MPALTPCNWCRSTDQIGCLSNVSDSNTDDAVVPPKRRRSTKRPRRGLILHLLRLTLFATIVLLIRQRHVEYRAERELARSGPIPRAELQKFYGDAAEPGDWDLTRGAQIVTDLAGTSLGFVVQTSPASDHITGYCGPTNVLIAFDTDYRVIGIDVLESADTAEHLEDVLGNSRFMSTYDGLSWRDAAALHDVDAVSGATLTSLAIVESISNRLGDSCPSLRFPDELSVDEIKQVLPKAISLRDRPDYPLIHDVFDSQDRRIGAVVRTSPTCDGQIGYQGPTDTLIVLDASDQIIRIVLRTSYDNQPYVRYVEEDNYFCSLFNGMTLPELAAMDLKAAQVEGVSGATMTSMGVAETLVTAASAATVRSTPVPSLVFSARDIGTCIILVLSLVITFTHLRGRPWLRQTYRVVVLVYLGFLNGDMLSQAQLAGWAQSGVPWTLAPGLVLLTAAALMVPLLTKRQIYCHHVCPFGAAQQLIRTRSRWRVRVPRWASHAMAVIPPALLILVVLTAMLHLPVNLAGIEPFNAFVFWIAGAATLCIFLFGLAASTFIPLAYCRYGCPTGAMLDYLRLHGQSDRISRRDWFALVLLAVALALS